MLILELEFVSIHAEIAFIGADEWPVASFSLLNVFVYRQVTLCD